MNEFETFTMQSPSADVLKWLTSGDVFSPEKVTEVATYKGLVGDIYQPNRLKALVESELFRKRFEDQWKYETDSKWVGRPVKKVVRETILHMISHLEGDAQLERMGMRSGQFPGLDAGQIDTMDKQLQFLADYYREFLRGES
jgi:hypothetical protein